MFFEASLYSNRLTDLWQGGCSACIYIITQTLPYCPGIWTSLARLPFACWILFWELIVCYHLTTFLHIHPNSYFCFWSGSLPLQVLGDAIIRLKWKCYSLSLVQLFVTPWTIAHQAPLSIEFSRQECWSVLPFPSLGNLPDPGMEPWSSVLQGDSLLSWATYQNNNQVKLLFLPGILNDTLSPESIFRKVGRSHKE